MYNALYLTSMTSSIQMVVSSTMLHPSHVTFSALPLFTPSLCSNLFLQSQFQSYWMTFLSGGWSISMCNPLYLTSLTHSIQMVVSSTMCNCTNVTLRALPLHSLSHCSNLFFQSQFQSHWMTFLSSRWSISMCNALLLTSMIHSIQMVVSSTMRHPSHVTFSALPLHTLPLCSNLFFQSHYQSYWITFLSSGWSI